MIKLPLLYLSDVMDIVKGFYNIGRLRNLEFEFLNPPNNIRKEGDKFWFGYLYDWWKEEIVAYLGINADKKAVLILTNINKTIIIDNREFPELLEQMGNILAQEGNG